LSARADLVYLRRFRIVNGRIGLQNDAKRPFGPNRLLRGRNRRWPPDCQRQNSARKQHRLSDRQNDDAILRQRLGLAGLGLIHNVRH
jgi:hypothetical protein